MFATVKQITGIMDARIAWVKDAMEHHECSEEEYQAYLVQMHELLTGSIELLKKQSENKKLVAKYEGLVNELFEGVLL